MTLSFHHRTYVSSTGFLTTKGSLSFLLKVLVPMICLLVLTIQFIHFGSRFYSNFRMSLVWNVYNLVVWFRDSWKSSCCWKFFRDFERLERRISLTESLLLYAVSSCLTMVHDWTYAFLGEEGDITAEVSSTKIKFKDPPKLMLVLLLPED